MALVKEVNSTRIMKLNVGGKKFEVNREMLTKVEGSHMAEFFKGEQQLKALKDGTVYIERDPKVFEDLLKHMRTNMTFMPENDADKKVL